MGKPKPRIKETKCRRKLGARTYKNYSKEMLELALESVSNKKISTRDAEKQFGIPRRTLINKLKSVHTKAVGSPTRLTIDEEQKLLSVLIASGEFGCPLTKFDLRMLVDSYLKKNGRSDVFAGKMPGVKWVDSFLKRHRDKLTVRSVQNISSARAEKAEDEIMNYFENLKLTIKDIPPSNILNYDETNCSDDPGTSKAIFKRGVKYPERVMNSTKGCISIMFTGTANGECLPPYVVYKAEHLYNDWILDGPDTARYNCTKSGWFDSANFEEYFKSIILKWAKTLPGPKVVIGDNLSSHLSPDVIELCEEYKIKFVFLPPSSTHLTQPLDVAFFAPLKKEWRKILLQYKIENPSQKTMNKKHFPALLKKLMEVAEMQSENIRSGFRATGIYPLNPREVLKRIPEFSVDSYSIDEALLNYLKQTRTPNTIKATRNKKINVERGRSVSLSDFGIDNILASKKTKAKEPKNEQSNCPKQKPKLIKNKSKTERKTAVKQTTEIPEIEIEAYQFEKDHQEMEIVKEIESETITQNTIKDNNTIQNKRCKKNSKHCETERLNLHKFDFETELRTEEYTRNRENDIYLDENTGILQEIEILQINEDRKTELIKEIDYDEIMQYEAKIHINVDKNKRFMSSNQQCDDYSVTTNILDETTGIMRTEVVSTAFIENPRCPVFGENFTLIQKSSTVGIEFTHKAGVVSDFGKGYDKENIWCSDTESNSVERSVNRNEPKPHLKDLKKKSIPTNQM